MSDKVPKLSLGQCFRYQTHFWPNLDARRQSPSFCGEIIAFRIEKRANLRTRLAPPDLLGNFENSVGGLEYSFLSFCLNLGPRLSLVDYF